MFILKNILLTLASPTIVSYDSVISKSTVSVENKLIIFVDGSNLYHSLVETGFKPGKVDYHKLFEKISNIKNPIVRFYIAALTKDFTEKERSSQQTFFSNLRKNPNLSIHFGKLQKTRNTVFQQTLVIKSLGFCNKCLEKAGLLLSAFSPSSFKEKGVDVKIAIDLVIMAEKNEFNTAILLSGDTDLVPAVEHSTKNKKVINAYFDLTSGKMLREASSSTFRITKETITSCLKD